jgi:hypothetical protein
MAREIQIGDLEAAIVDEMLTLEDGYGDLELNKKDAQELFDWLRDEQYVC